MALVSGDMKVAEVIHRWPATIEVFLGRGCPDMSRGLFAMMARVMSVRAAARVHRIDLNSLLVELNGVAERSHPSAA